jgi:predicted nucleic acid binding AN1-type Zn finger protein
MEFPNLGKHCYYCNQMDYLPFKCLHCTKDFCLLHRNKINHECPIKPRSKRVISEKVKSFKGFKCSYSKCKKSELMEIRCMWCKETMCIRHRFPTDHKCTKQKKKLFQKQSIKNDIKRIDKRKKKFNGDVKCLIQ